MFANILLSLDLSLLVLQDVLTDLSAECENLPIEGVPGACYAHKVHSEAVTVCVLADSQPGSPSPSLSAGHLPGCCLRLQEAGERRHPEPGLLRGPGRSSERFLMLFMPLSR